MFNIAIAVLNSKFIHSSLSVWCLLSGIKAYGNPEISPTVIEGTINQNVNDVATRILNCSPNLVGLSCYIWNIKQTNELISIIKKQSPGTIIVMGGPEVSYNAEAVLMRQSSVDYIISGEGELPFALLVNSIIEHAPVDNLPGICYRDNGKIVLSEPYISNKTPPSPYTSEYFEALNNRISYLESSRGCPYNCAFCLSGRCGSVRFFDIKDTKDNILKLANSGSKTIKFVDRTFNANRKRAEEIFSFIIENYGVVIPENVCFHFEIAGDILNESTINILSTAPPGSIQLEIGLQSFNEKTLQSISRRTDTIKLRENIKQILLSGNIHTHIDLIAGLPFEDMNSLKNSFNIAYDLHPHMLQFGFLKLLHGANMRVNID
ncbi:MAG: radical SAM protein, partial [Oscillospiraceae bacterium]